MSQIAKSNPMITPELQAIIDMKVAEALATRPKGYNLHCKVSNKGAVSVYGLNIRFPVTLYPEQWIALAKYMNTVLKFVDDNKLAIKDRQDNPIIVEAKQA